MFFDVGCSLLPRAGNGISGDVFLSRRLRGGRRVVAVLCDGLGDGVLACAPASLTAAMALEFACGAVDPARTASLLMDSLPSVSSQEGSASSFSLVDARMDGEIRVFEHGNPPCLVLDGAEDFPVHRVVQARPRWGGRSISVSTVPVREGIRVVLHTPELSGGEEGGDLSERVRARIRQDADLSATDLAGRLVRQTAARTGGVPSSDLGAAVLFVREPRRLLILTGPPFDPTRDGEMAAALEGFPGRKAICGGTTAALLSRLSGRKLLPGSLPSPKGSPVAATMEGVDLVTEGVLTLTRVEQTLRAAGRTVGRGDPAEELVRLMLGVDCVEFLVGTAVNVAHQDPGLPRELGWRRDLIRRIGQLLEERFFKEVSIRLL